MSDSAQALLDALLGLPNQEREELIFRVLESLPAGTTGLSLEDHDLEEKLLERELNTSKSVTWETLRLES